MLNTELFFDCADVDEVCELLRGKGIVVSEPETTFYGTKRVRLSRGVEMLFIVVKERASETQRELSITRHFVSGSG